MRTAFVSTGYYPTHSGGASISTDLIVDELLERGIEVDVFTTTGPDTRRLQLASNHVEIPSGEGYPLPTRVGKNYGVVRHLSDLSEYDLVHVYGLGPLPGINLRSPVPVLGTVNNLEWICINWVEYLRAGCPEYGFAEALRMARRDGYGPVGLPLKLGLETSFKALAKRADHFTAQTEGMASILTRCGYPGSRVTRVPNLLDPRFDVQGNDAYDENELVYVGRLAPKKGITDIVQSYVDLPDELLEEWTFSIYGDGQCREEVETIASNAGVDVTIGYCPYEDLPEVYRDATVLVHGSKYPEPFSRTWLEAMASETAIVCSENPSSRTVLDSVAAFYDPFDTASLEATLQDVLSDPDRRASMAERGNEAVAQYRPERVVSQYVTLYEELAG